jgi:transposase
VSESTMTTERRSEELPDRWSAQRKTEIVLRVIRGEAIDEVAREIQVPVHEVEEWRRVFLESGQQGLKRCGLDPEERELRRLQAKIGDMTMRLELAEHLLEKRGVAEDVRRLCGNEPAAQSHRGQAVSAADGVRRVARAALLGLRVGGRVGDAGDEARAKDGAE